MFGRIWHSSALLDVYMHHSNLCFCCHMTIFLLCLCVFIWCFLLCVSVSNFFFLIWTQLRWIRAHANDLILTWIYLQRPYFQLRSHSQVLRIITSACIWGGDQSLTHDSDHSCCSVAGLCPTLFDPMDCSLPGSSVLHCFPEFAQLHVHWVGDAL